MTITELIAVLQERLSRHGNVEVQVTWESRITAIDPSNIYLGESIECDGTHALLIDADGNFYKPELAFDPREGER